MEKIDLLTTLVSDRIIGRLRTEKIMLKTLLLKERNYVYFSLELHINFIM